MRSDDRFFFYLAAFAMTVSTVFVTFWHILPELDKMHNYVYGHCTITGKGHWEKYETVSGIKERVIVPVELRLGSIEGAMDWKKGSVQGAQDPYYQALGRDAPSGWEYFSPEDKKDYLNLYEVGREYECYARSGMGFREVVFHRQHLSKKLIPQVIFLAIVILLCMATGVCLGLVDSIRVCIGLPPMHDLKDDAPMAGVVEDSGKGYGSTGGGPQQRQFSSQQATGDREWV
ncbi:hypothetical protein T484DRAFT_1943157 [Baffinella frigidus]|nr:hypothetical protein T484DRAFT_1943157 [Cryptophyta sp. CCMP2293]